MAAERCPATKDGQQCVLPAGHSEQHQAPADPGWAPAATAPLLRHRNLHNLSLPHRGRSTGLGW